MVRRWLPVLLALVLPPLMAACGSWGVNTAQRPGVGPDEPTRQAAERQQLAERRARAEQQRRQERCQRERPALETRMAALRRAESRLAEVKEERYRPLSPPPPWDEAAESRFRQEDRDADWQRHQGEQETWQQREETRRARWWADHQARLLDAQEALNAEVRALRDQRADLFTAPGSIEFNPKVEEEIRLCRNLAAPTPAARAPAAKVSAARTMEKTAPP
jgi:hypothetical protein